MASNMLSECLNVKLLKRTLGRGMEQLVGQRASSRKRNDPVDLLHYLIRTLDESKGMGELQMQTLGIVYLKK